MNIDVTQGDVVVRSVVVRSHPEGLYTVEISTPMSRHPAVVWGSSAASGNSLAQFVDLYKNTARVVSMNPSRVMLTPESPGEEEALENGLFQLDDALPRSVVLIVIPSRFFDRNTTVASWEFRPGGVDYLPRAQSTL